MTALHYSYIGVAGSVILFIVSCWQFIVHTDQKGNRRVPAIGWVALVSAILFGIANGCGIYAANKEKIEERVYSDSVLHAKDSIYQLQRQEDSLKDAEFERKLLTEFKIARDSMNNSPKQVQYNTKIDKAQTVNIGR